MEISSRSPMCPIDCLRCDATAECVNYPIALQRSLHNVLTHIRESIKLMEKSKSACKSKTVALARAEAEKAREILEEMI